MLLSYKRAWKKQGVWNLLLTADFYQEGREGGEKKRTKRARRARARTRDLLRARRGSPAARHGGCLDKQAFPCL